MADSVTVKDITNPQDDEKWFLINGYSARYGYTFDSEVYALTKDNQVLDSDGCHIEGDYIESLVKELLKSVAGA